MTAVHTPRYFGIDGCPDGWFCVGVDAEAGWTITVIAADAIAKHVVSARAVFIDIPIGLVDSGPTERTCDLEARRMLGRPRGSSVFPGAGPGKFVCTRLSGGFVAQSPANRPRYQQTGLDDRSEDQGC